MIELPKDPFVEFRDGGHFIVGTRISIESVAYALLEGQSAEEIMEDFPLIGSREKLEGAIAFVRAHPREIEAYLEEDKKGWEEAIKLNPPELVEKLRNYRIQEDLKSA